MPCFAFAAVFSGGQNGLNQMLLFFNTEMIAGIEKEARQ